MYSIVDLVYTEHLKSKRSMGMVILVVGTFLGLLVGTFLYIVNKQVFIQDHTQWLALWGESNLFGAQIFVPMFLSIIIASNIKSELDNNNLIRIIVSPIKVTYLVMSKWLYIVALSLVNQVIGFLIFVILGYLLHLPGSVSIGKFLSWSILGWIGSSGVIAIQLWIALKAKNFTASLLVNFGIIIFGLIISIVNNTLGRFFPYNQIMIGLHARELTSFDQGQMTVFLLVVFFSVILGLACATRTVKKMLFK